MVAPLALPLLGLLGAGAGLAAQPYIEDRLTKARNKTQRDIRGGLLDDAQADGVDLSNPDAMARTLFAGGLLDADKYQGDIRGAHEGRQDRANALQRSRIAAGPGHARVAEDRRQFEVLQGQKAMERQAFSEFITNVAPPGTAEAFNNPFTPPQVRDSVMQTYMNRVMNPGADAYNPATDPALQRQLILDDVEAQRERASVPQIVQQDAQQRGMGWMAMKPDERADILTLETSIGTTESVLDYVQRTTAAGRASSAINSGEAAQYAREFELATLPYMQRLFQAGAMQAAEFELFDRLRGDPFAYNQFTEKEQASVQAVLNRMRSDLSSTNRSYGLHDARTSPSSVPQGLQPGLPHTTDEGLTIPRAH